MFKEIDEPDFIRIVIKINIEYEQMEKAVFSFFVPKNEVKYEITSWYQGFAFDTENLEIFFFYNYDERKDIYCFEMQTKDENKRKRFADLINDFEMYLCKK